MHGSGKVFLSLTLLLAAAFLFQRHGNEPRAEEQEQLVHFDGTIVPGRPTYDSVKFDLFVRARLALREGDAAKAEQLYRIAVSKYPDDESSFEALGACLVFQKRYLEAAAEYAKALALNPRSCQALYGLGCVAYEEERYVEARDFLVRALEIREEMADTHRLLAFVYDSMQEPANAVVQLERTIELNPSIPPDDYVRTRLKELKR